MSSSQCSYEVDPADHDLPATGARLEDVWSCAHARYDGTAYCVFHLPHDDPDRLTDPEFVDDQRSAFLEAVRSGTHERRQFLDARFASLDCEYEVLEGHNNHPIDLRFATVDGALEWSRTTVAHPVILDGAVLGVAKDRRPRFVEASFEATLSMVDTTVAGFAFSRASIAGTARFDESTFRRSSPPEESETGVGYRHRQRGTVSVAGARFEDGFRLSNATIHDRLDARNASFGGHARFTDVRFERRTDFTHSTFEHATFEGSICHGDLQLTDCTVTGSVSFKALSCHTHWEAVDEDPPEPLQDPDATGDRLSLSLRGARLTNATFEGATLDSLSCKRSPSVDRDHDRRTLFRGDEASFRDCVIFHDAEFGNDGLYEGQAARFDCRVSLFETEFRGRAGFRGVQFGAVAKFAGVAFGGRAVFANAVCESDLRILPVLESQDDLTITLVESEIPGGTFVQPPDGRVTYDFTRATVGDVDIHNRAVDVTDDDALLASALTGAQLGDERPGSLFDRVVFYETAFDGFDFGTERYQRALQAAEWRIHATTDGTNDESEMDDTHDATEHARKPNVGRLKGWWRELTGDPSLVSSAAGVEVTYLKAKNGANEVGDTNTASEFFVKQLTFRRLAHRHRCSQADSRHSTLGHAWAYLLNLTLAATCVYGERPGRVVASSAVTVVAFGALASLVALVPTVPAAGVPSRPGEALLFSAQSFVSLLTGQFAAVDHPIYSALSALEAFAGAFLVGLFVFTLTRSIHR